MALPPDIEEKLARCEAGVREMQIARLEIAQSVDDIVSNDGDDAIPDELFDDPSVVREVDALRRVEKRVRRASDRPATAPLIALGARR